MFAMALEFAEYDHLLCDPRALKKRGQIHRVPVVNYPHNVFQVKEGLGGISWAKSRGSLWVRWALWVPGLVVVVGTMCACGPAQVLVPHHLLQGPPPSAVCYLVRFKFATFHPDEDYLGLRALDPSNIDLIAVWLLADFESDPFLSPGWMVSWARCRWQKLSSFFPQRGRGWGAVGWGTLGGSPCLALSSHLKRTSPH